MTTEMTGGPGMQAEMFSYNVDNAYPESLVRALRKGMLSQQNYESLRTVSNAAEFKLALEDTDYGNDIFAGQEAGGFESQSLRRSMKEKLHKEIVHLIANSVYPLNAFLTQMLHGFQIDNVVYMIEGLKSGRQPQELLKMADPLGFFEELKTVQPVEGDDYLNLYQNVLIDLPIGIYFRKFLEQEMQSVGQDENQEQNLHTIVEVMQDYSLDQIQLRVRKIWLQEFHKWCMVNLNETSACVMDDLLKFECDMRTLNVINNSFSIKDIGNARGRESTRAKFITNLGYLYPDYMDKLNQCTDGKQLVEALDGTNYKPLLAAANLDQDNRNEALENENKIDDVILEESSRRYSMAFENGFHFGVFFAYFHLKQLEIKNVCWFADLVSMNIPKNQPGWNKFTVPFRYHVAANGGFE